MSAERICFLRTERLCFSVWTPDDLPLARALWGDPAVSRLICASGRFSEQEIAARLALECRNGEQFGVQYWPVFTQDGQLVGCCGLRPHGADWELGVHLRPAFWRQGYAVEAAEAAMAYAFGTLGAQRLFAGHHPDNTASRGLLAKLGFSFIGEEYYAPTGRMHPSYERRREPAMQAAEAVQASEPAAR